MQRALPQHRSCHPFTAGISSSCKRSRSNVLQVHASGMNSAPRVTTIHKLIDRFGTLTIPGKASLPLCKLPCPTFLGKAQLIL